MERLLDSKTKNFKGIIGMESSVKQAMLPHRKNTVKDNQLGFSSGAKNEFCKSETVIAYLRNWIFLFGFASEGVYSLDAK